MSVRNRDSEAIEDVVDAVDRIQRYTAAGRDTFGRDEMLQDAVLRLPRESGHLIA